MDALYSSGPIRFHSRDGTLVYTEQGAQGTTTRLQPQPSKLLQLLLDRYPDIVAKEEIQRSIWPDVEVEYEGSIHFCIRQIRSALGDDAAAPTFVETIARRGYRWMLPVHQEPQPDHRGTGRPVVAVPSPAQAHHKEAEADTKPHAPRRNWLLLTMAATSILAALFLFNARSGTRANTSTSKKLRIAIMPFVPQDTLNAFHDNTIAMALLDRLTNTQRERADVLGPTTTSTFVDSTLWNQLDAHRIDILINGKFSGQGDESQLLTEVIRTTDGAHVWVKRFNSDVHRDSLLERVYAGVLQEAFAYKAE